MKKDKITFIDEKKLEKQLEKKDSFAPAKTASDPIKERFAKYCLDKKQIKPDDLI